MGKLRNIIILLYIIAKLWLDVNISHDENHA